MICQKIKELAGDGALVFVTGDFGDQETGKAFATLQSCQDVIFFQNTRLVSFKVAGEGKRVERFLSGRKPVYADFHTKIPR